MARVDKGRIVSNSPIVSSASPHTPFAVILIFIWCGQSMMRVHARHTQRVIYDGVFTWSYSWSC